MKLQLLLLLTFKAATTTTNGFLLLHPYDSKINTTTNQFQLNAKQKKRFAQTIHTQIPTTNNNNKNKNKNNNTNKKKKNPLLKSKMDIDDLESLLMNKWGNNNNNNNNSNKSDFYDEDDEGYEEGNNNGNSHNNNFMNLSGGVVTRSRGQSSEFFRPVNIDDDEKETNNHQSKKRRDKEEIVAKKKNPIIKTVKKKQNQDTIKLQQSIKLNEHGKEEYLTLGQAELSLKAKLKNSHSDDDKEEESSKPTWNEIEVTNERLIQNLMEMSCYGPLPVQVQSIPAVLSDENDVVIGTHTGSGKTISYLLPLIQQLITQSSSNNNTGTQVIVVCPGRELASQVNAVCKQLCEGTDLKSVLCIGGTPFKRNLDNIRKTKPQIIIGTPGRIAELVVGKDEEKSGRLKISSLKALVLDEFDALFQYKVHQDPSLALVDTVKRQLRDRCKMILCSATASDMSDSATLSEFLRPGFVAVSTDVSDEYVTQNNNNPRVSLTAIHGVIHVPHKRLVLDTLRKILYTEPNPQQVLVFVDNSRRVDIVVEKLQQMGIVAAPLHGGLKSDKDLRKDVNESLREGRVGLVISTELSARGIDAPYLTHVVNLDLPTDTSHYAHRAGRCGRGERPGVVINITTNPKDRNVPQKFANALGITMHNVEPQQGKLKFVEDYKGLYDDSKKKRNNNNDDNKYNKGK